MLGEDAPPADRDPRLDALESAALDSGTRSGGHLPATASLTLVVPLYNEVRRFARFADTLAEFIAAQAPGSTLLFVDDGSDDGTADLADAFLASQPSGRTRLVRRPHRGKGAAVQAGLEAATTPLAGVCGLAPSPPPPPLGPHVHPAPPPPPPGARP